MTNLTIIPSSGLVSKLYNFIVSIGLASFPSPFLPLWLATFFATHLYISTQPQPHHFSFNLDPFPSTQKMTAVYFSEMYQPTTLYSINTEDYSLCSYSYILHKIQSAVLQEGYQT